MKINFLPSLLIFIAGAMVPLAIAFNGRIGQAFKSPLLGAAAVPAVGILFMALVLTFVRPTLPSSESFSEIPWYAWLGGAMVTTYFIILIFNAPKVGLGFAVSLVVAGQLFVSVIIDHFGLLGLPVAPISWGRVAGALSIILGVALLKYF